MKTEARETGIIEEIRLDNCVNNPQRSPSVFDLILFDKCHNEPNITMLLNTAVTGATVTQNMIRQAVCDRISTEDQFMISADIFVDCTGDGRLGFEAGAAFLYGRESVDQFGESLAQLKSDNKHLGSSFIFQARKHDKPMPFKAPKWARKFNEEDLKLRPHADPNTADMSVSVRWGLVLVSARWVLFFLIL